MRSALHSLSASTSPTQGKTHLRGTPPLTFPLRSCLLHEKVPNLSHVVARTRPVVSAMQAEDHVEISPKVSWFGTMLDRER